MDDASGEPRRLRKRPFAWASDSSGHSEERSSSSSEQEQADDTCDRWEDQQTVEIHTQVSEAVEYFQLREQSMNDHGAPTKMGAGPRGERVVVRRQERLQALRGRRPLMLREIAKQLRGRGFVRLVDFLGPSVGSNLLEGFAQLSWQPGRLGDAQSSDQSRSLRGDEIAWPSLSEAGRFGEALQRWMQALDELVADLRLHLNRPDELLRVERREPPMASCYPQHARYIRHYDNNCDEGLGDCNGRRLTAVYYLNKGMSHSDGGHLRILGQRGIYDLLPDFDTLTLFWADRRTPHEVMPNLSERKRLALSCWYVDVTEAPDAPAFPMRLESQSTGRGVTCEVTKTHDLASQQRQREDVKQKI
ncbi:unnamed protein product [Durusdinium trenchii]|uniref:Uncharacterized protein n=2 Tax=Durusdinium trenchii TaxID=1381693 RepID=A0ABP0SJS1_9DINO